MKIPLHHDREHSQAVMAALPRSFRTQLQERAQLAFLMAQIAEAAGLKQRRHPKGTIFGGFRTGPDGYVNSRIRDAYGPKAQKAIAGRG